MMVCPKCGGKTTVTDCVFNPETNEYYRKRRCLVCGNTYYTMEFEVENSGGFKVDWNNHHRCSKREKEK